MINGLYDIIPIKLKKNVLSKLDFSYDMYNFLISVDINKYKLIDIILGAPICISIKKDIFKELLQYEDKKNIKECINYESFYYHYYHIKYFLDRINNLKNNEFILSSMYMYNEDLKTHEIWEVKPCKKYDDVIKLMKSYNNYSYMDLELYELVDDEYKSIADFCIINDQISYFSMGKDITENAIPYLADTNVNNMGLDLPIPFKVGDLLEIDCSPFITEKQYVIITNIDGEDPYETVGVLLNIPNKIVNLKNGFIDQMSQISPLYRIKSIDWKELPLEVST